MLNLDAIQARADAAMNLDSETDAYIVAARWSQAARDVPQLVAELRAARDAVSFTRKAAGFFHGSTHGDAAAAIVAAYDKVAGEVPDVRG